MKIIVIALLLLTASCADLKQWHYTCKCQTELKDIAAMLMSEGWEITHSDVNIGLLHAKLALKPTFGPNEYYESHFQSLSGEIHGYVRKRLSGIDQDYYLSDANSADKNPTYWKLRNRIAEICGCEFQFREIK